MSLFFSRRQIKVFLHSPWIGQTFYYLLEQTTNRILDAGVIVALVWVLSEPEFGLFSVYQSWAAILLFLFPETDDALYRNYAYLKKRKILAREMLSYRFFNWIKIALAFVFCLLFPLFDHGQNYSTKVIIFTCAIVISFSHSFFGFLRKPLRLEMNQRMVVVVGAFQRLSLILMIFLTKYLKPESLWLAGMVILNYFIFGFVWKKKNKKLFKKQKLHVKKALKRMWVLFSGTALWLHLNWVASQAAQSLDTFALGFYKNDLKEIGFYSIANRASTFFQVIQIVMIAAFKVYLGRANVNRKKEVNLVFKFTLIFFILSFFLYFLAELTAAPLLQFFSSGKLGIEELHRTIQYFRWQVIGTLIFCICLPVYTYLSVREGLKNVTLFVFAPSFLSSILVYFYSAIPAEDFSNILQTAKANLFVDFFTVFLLFAYFAKFTFRKKSGLFWNVFLRRSNV
ncbi:MAG: lipopolysaccharide biosynthesis protein [Bacteriovoracia bacterium]